MHFIIERCFLELIFNGFTMDFSSFVEAITQNQLYGAFDEVTREWSDGVAAELIRNATRDNHNPAPRHPRP